MLTQARLKELLHYHAESGIFRWRVPNGCIKAWQVAGCLTRDGYGKIKVDRKTYLAHRLAWRYVHGEWPVDQIDHINGCRTDNRICNLREATGKENTQNRRRPASNNTTGFLGVSLLKGNKKYQARIRVGGKLRYLGSFKTAEQAHAVYLAAKREQHEFCTI